MTLTIVTSTFAFTYFTSLPLSYSPQRGLPLLLLRIQVYLRLHLMFHFFLPPTPPFILQNQKTEMLNPSPRPRIPRAARSPESDGSYRATPPPPPPPLPHALHPSTYNHLTPRATRATSHFSDSAALQLDTRTTRSPSRAPTLPDHYTFAPTIPCPFTGTLEASLDAILTWGAQYCHTQCVTDTLLRSVNSKTNWRSLLTRMAHDGNNPPGRGRYLLEELLFLVTRTLLPEQVLENREAMRRLYDRKKQLAIRFVLRYDMLREWKTGDTQHAVTVASLPPPTGQVGVPGPRPARDAKATPYRRRLMPNIIATLIVAPPGGWTTHGVKERMKHHVTPLDDMLLLTDEEVSEWSEERLTSMAVQVILHWQWLRQNTEELLNMEVNGWEELEGKADECQWFADDVKKAPSNRKEKGAEKEET